MKRFSTSAVIFLLVGSALYVFQSGMLTSKLHPSKPTLSPLPREGRSNIHTTPLAPESIELAQSTATGESHSQAVSSLVDLAKRQQMLGVSDVQSLLGFISGPKPSDLTDGEWEERINVILNLLRQQAEESVKGASSKKQADGRDIPSLTDYLRTTAEKHPSRILRLYAMQHLTLWYPRESSAEKRREIVALLERLAEKDGGETAGSAVLFLNDLQRDAAATGTGGQIVNEEVIGRAALRLAADSAAKQDVRISALHTCIARKQTDALPAARQIAADTNAVIPLRKTAIHSIGQLGSSEDQALLKHLESETPDLRSATEPAIKTLQAKVERTPEELDPR